MTEKELDAMKYKICCPMCDNYKCLRGTEKCEAELWKKWRMKQMANEEAREVLGDVRAYLASRASLENETLAGHTFTDICNAIKKLEQTRWIPVSERLPKETGWYLITFKTTNGVAVCELSYRKPENYWTDKDISKKVLDNNDVIAWKPLPQPYKAESEGE